MDQGLIPRRYAKALLDVAESRGVASGLYARMLRLLNAFESEPQLGRTVANPFVAIDDKARLLETAAGCSAKDPEDATFTDFVRLLVRNRRIDLMREMTQAYIALYRQAHDIIRVDIASAAPLSKDARERLNAIIGKKMPPGGTIELHETVDPDLIGGFVVNINNERLDASVRNEIDQLRLHLLK